MHIPRPWLVLAIAALGPALGCVPVPSRDIPAGGAPLGTVPVMSAAAHQGGPAPWIPDWDRVDDLRGGASPWARPLLRMEPGPAWTFDDGTAGWGGAHSMDVAAADGRLHCTITGHDPYVFAPALADPLPGPVRVTVRLRSPTAGALRAYWITTGDPTWSERQAANIGSVAAKTWTELTTDLPTEGDLVRLRLDPPGSDGVVEVDHVRLERPVRHPLEIHGVRVRGREVTWSVTNHGPPAPVACGDGAAEALETGATRTSVTTAPGRRPFEAVRLEATAGEDAPVGRTVVLHHPDVPTPAAWRVLEHGDVRVEVAPDGIGARVLRSGTLACVLAPLARPLGVDGDVGPPVTFTAGAVEDIEAGDSPGDGGVRVTLESPAPHRDRLHLELRGAPARLHMALHTLRDLEAPAVRIPGALEQGLLGGVEHLGAGEVSSSRLDIRTPDHVRFTPDRLHVTLHLAAVVTADASAALRWDDGVLQPAFAAPNAWDGTGDHRMAVRGPAAGAGHGAPVSAVLAVGAGWDDGVRLADWIEWASRAEEPPTHPDWTPRRPWDVQQDLYRAALDGPLRGADKSVPAWGHCVEQRWTRAPFVDMAAAHWRLTGELLDLENPQPGGAHVSDEGWWLATGRAEEWLQRRLAGARATAAAMRDDGTWPYAGKYADGHFEDTASGWSAGRAVAVLDAAWRTGDPDLRRAGLRAVAGLERFRTPRGAQTWEVGLHTPDILGSAHLVRAHVLAWRLTGEDEHLRTARRWAWTGMPFAYHWSNTDVMNGATIAVLGATNWRAPLWIGLPVQWCGTVHADALLDLAEAEAAAGVDDPGPWRTTAEAITSAGERMVPLRGPFVGCLPDSWHLDTRSGGGPWINPCALLQLRLRLRGEAAPGGLYQAAADGHTVVSAWPVTITDGAARVDLPDTLPAGARPQVVVDGTRVLDVPAGGVVPLD